MITLAPPRADEWSGGTVQTLGTRTVITGITTAAVCKIEYLPIGHQLTVRATVRSAKKCAVTVAETYHLIPANAPTTVEATFTCGASFEITIAGTNRVELENLTITDPVHIPAEPYPAHVLSLQAYFPLIAALGARFDYSRFNRDAYSHGTPHHSAAMFNEALWDTKRFYSENLTHDWQDITAPVTSLSVTRGVTNRGPIFAAEVGILTISAAGGLDPRELGLTYGAPVRLVYWPDRIPVFTGNLTSQSIEFQPPRSATPYNVTLTASDAVARLAQITRHGARVDASNAPEPWVRRIERLMRSAPDVAYSTPSSSYIDMCPSVWETNLAKHIDAACASVGGMWWVSRNNVVNISAARPSTTAAITLSDAEDTDLQARRWSYTASDTKWDSGETIASITVTNHGMKIENGDLRADDTTTTVTDPTASTAWNGTNAAVDMTLAAGVEQAARSLLRRATELPVPSRVTIEPSHRSGPKNRLDHMSAAAVLDPLTSASVATRGDAHPTVITRIGHSITPRTWKTTLTLVANR